MARRNHLPIRLLAIAAVAMLAAEARANLISNGNFSGGNTGFTSDYSYNTLNPGPELVEGSYSVVTQASDAHLAWGPYFDTNYDKNGDETGKYFVANASSDTSKAVWKSNAISVAQANTPYRFEAYLAMIYPSEGNPPQLSFEIGDGTSWTPLGQTRTFDLENDSPGQWYLSYADGRFTAAGTYFVRLKNSNGASGGNDLGLDDIYFGLRSNAPSVGTTPGVATPPSFNPTPVPEPSSLALAAIGVALGWRALRRRTRS